MPYEKNEDLPQPIKDALPADAQSIFRNAFNSALEKTKDEEGAAKQAWGAVTNAGFKKGEDGKWKKFEIETFEFDAEIFSVGVWNNDKYSERDLDDIVAHFSELRDSIKPPIKLGHTWKQGQPALGWVKDVKRVGKKLIATLSDVPKLVYDSIKAGRYKRVSSEIYWNFKSKAGKTYNYVLKAVALLGADIPAVDNLKDLEAYLLIQNVDTDTFERIASYDFEGITDEAGNIIFNHRRKQRKEFTEMDEKEYQAKLASEEAARKKAEDDAKQAAAKLKKFQQEQADELKKTRKTEVKEFCDKQVNDKKMLPAERDKIFEALDSDKIIYDTERGYGITFELFKSFAEKHDQIIETREHGHSKDKDTGESADEEVARKSKEYALKHNVSYEDASTAILDADPKLAERYKYDE
jgi:cation transport regulator